MALFAKVGSFNTGTGVATTAIPVTGVGFQPTALILWWDGSTGSVDAASATHARRGMGFVTGTTSRRCCASVSEDAQTAADTDDMIRDDAAVVVMAHSGTTTATRTDGLLDLQSFDSDGFTMVVDDQFTADYRIHYLALGGTDLTNVAIGDFTQATATGTQDTTSVGFQPDCVLFLYCSTTGALPVSQADSRWGFGAITATAQASYNGGSNDGAATIQTISHCQSSECLNLSSTSVNDVIARAEFSAMLSNGFRLNWLEADANARNICYLALKGGRYALGTLQTQTDTTTDIVESGFGFSPKAALFMSHGNTESTPNTAQDHDRWSVGAFSSISDRAACATMDVDALADSQTTIAVEHDGVYINIGTADAVVGIMDVKSVDADGFTCIMDDADPSQSFVFYIAFGNTANPASLSINSEKGLRPSPFTPMGLYGRRIG